MIKLGKNTTAYKRKPSFC